MYANIVIALGVAPWAFPMMDARSVLLNKEDGLASRVPQIFNKDHATVDGGSYGVLNDATKLRSAIQTASPLKASSRPSGHESPVRKTDTEGIALDKTCTEGTSFRVTAPDQPLIDACFLDTGLVIEGQALYSTEGTTSDVEGQAFVLALSSIDNTAGFAWYMGYVESEDVQYVFCGSTEDASTVHPSEATWFCDLAATGDVSIVSEDELDVSCGCRGAYSSTGSTSSRHSSSTSSSHGCKGETCCSEGSDFTVTAPSLPETEGCYTSTGDVVEGGPVYGLPSESEIFNTSFVFPTYSSDDPWDVRYSLGGAFQNTLSEDLILYCYSSEQSDETHPADATWKCDLDGAANVLSANLEKVEDEVFAVTCGCTA